MLERLRPEEPPVERWTVATTDEFAVVVQSLLSSEERPAVVAVDGRSGGGKTTLAERLRSALPAATVVHTDDVAWHHSFFDWADLLISGVLGPARDGQAVGFRPPAWDKRERDGAIVVPAGTAVLLVDGVGAGRTDLAPWTDVLIWVQSDYAEAERRGVLRDGGDERAASFWREWMEQEGPFQAANEPWTRADLIVNGTPTTPLFQGQLQYAVGPLPTNRG